MKNIAIIAGGNSSEYEVSMKSGKNIYDEVDETRYNKYLVVLKERDWHVEIGEEKYPVDMISRLPGTGRRSCLILPISRYMESRGRTGCCRGIWI